MVPSPGSSGARASDLRKDRDVNFDRDSMHWAGWGKARTQPGSRVLAWLLVGLLVFPGTPVADSTSTSEPSEPDTSDITNAVTLPAGKEVLPPAPRPFVPGESLKFSVQYGFIKAGTAYLEVQNKE